MHRRAKGPRTYLSRGRFSSQAREIQASELRQPVLQHANQKGFAFHHQMKERHMFGKGVCVCVNVRELHTDVCT